MSSGVLSCLPKGGLERIRSTASPGNGRRVVQRREPCERLDLPCLDTDPSRVDRDTVVAGGEPHECRIAVAAHARGHDVCLVTSHPEAVAPPTRSDGWRSLDYQTFADADEAFEVDQAEHAAHGVGGGAVGLVLVALAEVFPGGEGGVLALTALVSRGLEGQPRRRWWLVGFGIFGAAMFYGDGMITPAISVLSAVEGLEVMAPGLHPYVVPTTIAILVALFAVQKFGTSGVGRWFGPITLVWFFVIIVALARLDGDIWWPEEAPASLSQSIPTC